MEGSILTVVAEGMICSGIGSAVEQLLNPDSWSLPTLAPGEDLSKPAPLP